MQKPLSCSVSEQPQPQFHLMPIADIIVGDRFRKDYGNVLQLAESIKQFGLLHPLVVARDGRLLAGGRRLEALKLLGFSSVPIHYIDEADDLLVREIELEENLLREDLTWQEAAHLRVAIHELKLQLYGQANTSPRDGASVVEAGWSLRRTADLTNTRLATIHDEIRLVQALKVIPSLANETNRSNAVRTIDRLEQDLANEIARRQADRDTLARLESQVICGDSLELIRSLADDSVDCIITDPPYGVNVGDDPWRTEANFDDSPEAMLATLQSIAPQMRRVLKPSGHFYAFFSPRYWHIVHDIYRAVGFDVGDFPLIWAKPGPATGTGNWDRSFATSWEVFLYATSPDRRLTFKRKDVFTFASDNIKQHPAQKPIDLLRELIQLSTQPNDIVFDPFVGSGATLVAAAQLERRFLGYELEPRYHAIALNRLLNEGKPRPYMSQGQP